jgi:hypothetical protein
MTRRAVMSHVMRALHGSHQDMTELSFSDPAIFRWRKIRGSNLDAHLLTRLGQKVRMLLSFQRPSRPVGKGIPSKGRSAEPKFLERDRAV